MGARVSQAIITAVSKEFLFILKLQKRRAQGFIRIFQFSSAPVLSWGGSPKVLLQPP
jgi:hypothetical protein